MLRFVIVVVFYALAVIGLPRWTPFADLMKTLSRIPPTQATLINVGAILAAGGVFYLLTRKPSGWIYKRPSSALEVLRMGLIGVLFAGFFDLLQGLSGYSMVVENLAIIPLAFIVAETVYVLLRWGWRTVTNTGAPPRPRGPDAVAADSADDDEEDNNLTRLLITVPIYVLVIIFLPRQEDFRQLSRQLVNIAPNTGAIISGLALVLAAAGGFFVAARAGKTLPGHIDTPEQYARAIAFADVKLRVYLSFWIGVAFAALINLSGFFIGSAPAIIYLILIPIGTFSAELIYQVFVWRIKYGPPDI